MKICWDNLKKLKYRPDRTEWQSIRWPGHFYIYKEKCLCCNEPFLFYKHGYNGDYCSYSCSKKYKKHSEETKKKISKSNKGNTFWLGKKHSKKTKEKLSYLHKGKKHSEETKKKISETITKQWKNPKYRNKLTILRIGVGNPNWKGGIAGETYCSLWSDKDYKESIKERDGYKCLNPYCSKENNDICLHHINYNKKDCRPNNLITLCNSCNGKANKDRNWHKSWYSAIIYQRYYQK